MAITGSSTVDDARQWVRDHAEEVLTCPACRQHVQVYRRKLNSGMARSLIIMWRTAGQDYVHLPTQVGARSREEGKLRYWGLVEEAVDLRPDGGRAGWWRLTDLGAKFVQGRATVAKYAIVYNGRCIDLVGDQVDIMDCLNQKFVYAELIHDSGDIQGAGPTTVAI